MRTTLVRSLAAALSLSAGATVLAQSAPPIRPGLWQVKMENEGAGMQQMPDMAEQLKNLPPEQRQQVEAMMKSRGVDMSGGPGMMKVCLSKESLDQGRWQGEHGSCKTDVTQRSSSSWKWHSVCADPASVSDGEATFANAENYTVRNTTTMTADKRTVKTTLTSKWLGADCGDVKPVQPPAKQK